MATREAHAEWHGTLKEGSGEMALGSGSYKGPFSFVSRFENGTGTNPEELIGAAHAGCFSMALSAALGHSAMTTVLAALTRAARDDDAGTRQRVIDAFFAPGPKPTAIGPLTVEPDGVLAAPRFSTYRLSGGRRVYAPGT